VFRFVGLAISLGLKGLSTVNYVMTDKKKSVPSLPVHAFPYPRPESGPKCALQIFGQWNFLDDFFLRICVNPLIRNPTTRRSLREPVTNTNWLRRRPWSTNSGGREQDIQFNFSGVTNFQTIMGNCGFRFLCNK
jgi:hypothetical protein